ncbi:MAG: acetylglutamate kinase [Verrucomicrobia bacterium]|nr:acetylglutamate kinase [Verrucomicrobiota bacterium]
MESDLSIQRKTEVLLEALPYVQRFRDSIFVVKFGGSFLDTEQAREGVAMDLAFLATVGIHVIVVHGGGPAINKAMQRAGIEPVWKDGLRFTDKATVSIVERTLNEEINAGICGNIEAKGGRPVGIRGQDIFQCERLQQDGSGNPVDLGFVGKVVGVNAGALRERLGEGRLLVVSPVGADGAGQVYNTNADTAAAHLAAAVGARRLVYLCDVPGLLRDPADPSTLISSLSREEVPGLRTSGVIGTGMLPKVESALFALERGVHRVHLIDGRLPHSVLLEIFTDEGIGTEIVRRTGEES